MKSLIYIKRQICYEYVNSPIPPSPLFSCRFTSGTDIDEYGELIRRHFTPSRNNAFADFFARLILYFVHAPCCIQLHF